MALPKDVASTLRENGNESEKLAQTPQILKGNAISN